MHIHARLNRWGRIGSLVAWSGLLSACAGAPISPAQTPSALSPSGPDAAHIANLIWMMVSLALLVVLLVTILLVGALLRNRRATAETPPAPEDETGRRWLIWGGIVLPLVILGILFVSAIQTLAAVTQPQDAGLHVQIVGRQWWWEVNYREQGFATANELHIPVGVPVQITLESGDVIHSFWVPELHGKMDLIPGRVNSITFQADEAGMYRGECAEFCGLQHAHMGFMVIAESEDAFNQWLAAQQQPAGTPEDDTAAHGQDVFLSAGCANCHMVRGLDDTAVDASVIDLGPDLTHLQTRITLAGATLNNNRGNLAGWIVDPQHIKPGSLMPPMALSSDDLQALLAYLETLT